MKVELESSLNRRQFFKYAFVGSVGGAASTYSPKSHAFAFTAMAIATGEQIGWSAYPPMLAGGEYVKMLYKEMSNALGSSKIKAIYQGTDSIVEQFTTIDQLRYKGDIEPITDYCTYNDQSQISIAAINKLSKLTSSIPLSYVASSNSVVDIEKGISLLLNDDDPVPYSQSDVDAISGVIRCLNQGSATALSNNTSNVPKIFLNQMLHAISNHYIATKTTNLYQTHNAKVNATYHSESWRNALNLSAASVTLAGEYNVLQATNNRILFDILVEKQVGLLVRCLHLIEKLDR